MSTYFSKSYHPSNEGSTAQAVQPPRVVTRSPGGRTVISLSRVKDVISGHDGLPRFPAPPDLSGKNRPDRAMRITELLGTSTFGC